MAYGGARGEWPTQLASRARRPGSFLYLLLRPAPRFLLGGYCGGVVAAAAALAAPRGVVAGGCWPAAPLLLAAASSSTMVVGVAAAGAFVGFYPYVRAMQYSAAR